MNKVKSINLSIEEITAIFAITDESLRNRAIQAITTAAENPEAVNIDDYLDGDPLILELVWRIVRKDRMARERRERRAANPQQRKPRGIKNSAKPLDISGHSDLQPVEIDMSESNVRRLLWVRQHFNETIEQVTRVLAIHSADWMSEDLAKSLKSISEMVYMYLQPSLKSASEVAKLPRRLRPRTIPVPATPRTVIPYAEEVA